MAERVSEPNIKQLLIECREAIKNAYIPYSKFAVGAAIETTSGVIYRGCNIENAAYTGCICAERTAIAKAVSDGFREFKAIAITSNMPAPDIIVPCGTCRQFIREFSTDLVIYLVRPDLTYEKTSLAALLPKSFGPQDLEKG
ncbi:unnamed protein product, partial [Medioppia subpectinata]